MGDLVLKGSTSGQITVTPTAVAGTNTLTLPAKTGNIITSADTGTVTQTMLGTNIAGNGPAFSAYLSPSQSISSSTWTKVQCNVEDFDTALAYDNTTNYRFQPTIAGYYQVNAAVEPAGTSITRSIAAVYKYDGSTNAAWKEGGDFTAGYRSLVSCLVYLNGTTQYIELWTYITATSPSANAGSRATWFQAALVRAA